MSSQNQSAERKSIIGLFLWSGLILLSAGLLIYLVVAGGQTVGEAGVTLPRPVVTPEPGGGGGNQPEGAASDISPAQPGESGGEAGSGMWALWISALTLITSTVGLVSNAWLGWRKELRAARRDRLEAQQLRAELEKTLLEVQQLRAELAGEKDA